MLFTLSFIHEQMTAIDCWSNKFEQHLLCFYQQCLKSMGFLRGEFPGDPWIPFTKNLLCRKRFRIWHHYEILTYMFWFYWQISLSNSLLDNDRYDLLWPRDAVWRHWTGWKLAQIMAPSHYQSHVRPLKLFYGHHLKVISQEVLLMNLICNMCSELTLFELSSHLWAANGFIWLTIGGKLCCHLMASKENGC